MLQNGRNVIAIRWLQFPGIFSKQGCKTVCMCVCMFMEGMHLKCRCSWMSVHMCMEDRGQAVSVLLGNKSRASYANTVNWATSLTPTIPYKCFNYFFSFFILSSQFDILSNSNNWAHIYIIFGAIYLFIMVMKIEPWASMLSKLLNTPTMLCHWTKFQVLLHNLTS